MGTTKTKIATVLLLTAALAAGTGVLTHSTLAAKQADLQAAETIGPAGDANLARASIQYRCDAPAKGRQDVIGGGRA